MAPQSRDRPDSDPPAQVCARCSKPIPPGTGALLYGRAVHIRCLTHDTQLEAIEQQDRAAVALQRARAAVARSKEILEAVRGVKAQCPVCGEPLGTSRGVLFQGDTLVHAACRRADP